MYAACTHAVLSGGALARIESSAVTKLIVTDTLPLPEESEKIEVESVARIFAEAMKRMVRHQSISSLFDVDKG